MHKAISEIYKIFPNLCNLFSEIRKIFPKICTKRFLSTLHKIFSDKHKILCETRKIFLETMLWKKLFHGSYGALFVTAPLILAVNYFCRTLHLRCLIEFRIRLCYLFLLGSEYDSICSWTPLANFEQSYLC